MAADTPATLYLNEELKGAVISAWNGEFNDAERKVKSFSRECVGALQCPKEHRLALHWAEVLMAKNFVCENKVYMDATVERFQAACTQASEYKTGIEYVVRDRAATTAALAANKKLCNCRFDALLVNAECLLFLAYSQMLNKSYLKGLYNLKSAHDELLMCYNLLQEVDAIDDTVVDQQLRHMVYHGYGWFALYVAILGQLLGPLTVTILQWVTSLQGNLELGKKLLAEVAAGDGVRAPLASLNLILKAILFPELEFPRDDVELKDSKDAKEMLEKGLERYETSPHFIILYGVALRRKGQVEESRVLLEKCKAALEAQGVQSYTVSTHISHSHTFALDFETGLPEYRVQATADDSAHKLMGYFFMSMCYAMMGNLTDAYDHINCAVEVGKADGENRDLRAMAERLANRDENLLPFAFYDFLTWFKLQLPPEKLNRALEMLESIGKKYGVEDDAPPSAGGGGWLSGLLGKSAADKIRDAKMRQKLSFYNAKGYLLLRSDRRDDAQKAFAAVDELDSSIFSANEMLVYWLCVFENMLICYQKEDYNNTRRLAQAILDGRATTPQQRKGAEDALSLLAKNRN